MIFPTKKFNNFSRFLVILALTYLIQSTLTQHDYDFDNNDDGPCGRYSPGNADLNTFDLIREFRLDSSTYEEYYEGVTEVVGSSTIQRAYRLQRESNLTISATEAFPHGVPHKFSFECTFRAHRPPEVPWYLFHLTDSYESTQLSVLLNPPTQTLELILPDANGELQRVSFQHASVRILNAIFNQFAQTYGSLSVIRQILA